MQMGSNVGERTAGQNGDATGKSYLQLPEKRLHLIANVDRMRRGSQLDQCPVEIEKQARARE